MGVNFSCCCRRRRNSKPKINSRDEEERQPLLQNNDHDDANSEPNAFGTTSSRTTKQVKARFILERLSSVISALRAGKLPSQSQLNEVARRILASGCLDADITLDQHPVVTAGLGSAGPTRITETSNEENVKDIDQLLNKLILDAKTFLEAILQFGLEKNNDDLIQETINHLKILDTRISESSIIHHSDDWSSTSQTISFASFLPLITSHTLRTNVTSLIFTLISIPALSGVSSVASDVASTAVQISEKIDGVTQSANAVQDLVGTVGDVAGVVGGLAGIAEGVVREVEEVAEEIEGVIDGHGGAVVQEEKKGVRVAQRSSFGDNVSDAVADVSNVEQQQISPMAAHSDEVSKKTTFLSQLENLLNKAHTHESDLAALRALLNVLARNAAFAEVVLSAAELGIEESKLATSIGSVSSEELAGLDSAFREVSTELKTFLNRLTSSNNDTPPIFDQIMDVFSRIISTLLSSDTHPTSSSDSDFRAISARLHVYLKTSLSPSTAHFAQSPEGRRLAEEIYDSFNVLFSLEESALARDVRLLAKLIGDFIDTLKSDRAISCLFTSIKALSTDFGSFLQMVLSFRSIHDTSRSGTVYDIVSHTVISLLPSIFRKISRYIKRQTTVALPMPRIEYVSKDGSLMSGYIDNEAQSSLGVSESGVEISAAIDALMLHVSLDSDLSSNNKQDGKLKLHFVNLSDFTVDVFPREIQAIRSSSYEGPSTLPTLSYSNNNASSSSVTSNKTRTQILIHATLPNFNLHMQDVSYFGKYWNKPRWLHWTRSLFCGMCEVGFGYEDEGLLSIDIGGKGKDATVLDVEICIDTSQGSSQTAHSTNAKVTLPSLKFQLQNTAHPIINALVVSPFGGPLVRKIAESYLQSQLESAVEYIVKNVVQISDAVTAAKTHSENKDINWKDIWAAVVDASDFNGRQLGEEEEEGTEEMEQNTESHVIATTKGVIHSSVTTIIDPSFCTSAEQIAPPTRELITSSIAVGINPLLLPDKARPLPPTIPTSPLPTPGHVINTISNTAHDVVGSTKNKVLGMYSDAEQVRRGLKQGKMKEERKQGWRSHAFDLSST